MLAKHLDYQRIYGTFRYTPVHCAHNLPAGVRFTLEYHTPGADRASPFTTNRYSMINVDYSIAP